MKTTLTLPDHLDPFGHGGLILKLKTTAIKKNNLRGLAVLLLSTALVTSIGCEGPAGPTGPTGPIGEKGDVGSPGLDGNSNVLVKTITVTDQDYIDGSLSAKHTNNSLFFFPAKIANIEDSDITEDIVANGLVLAYIEVPIGLSFEPSQWVSIPYSYRHQNQIYTVNYSSAYSLNTFTLAYYFTRNMEGTMPDIRNWVAPDNSIKIVIISGTVAGQLSTSSIDLSNLNDVEEFLKLEGY